jgi:hypothetical protein
MREEQGRRKRVLRIIVGTGEVVATRHVGLTVPGRNVFQPEHVEFSYDPGPPVGIRRSIYGEITFNRQGRAFSGAKQESGEETRRPLGFGCPSLGSCGPDPAYI